MLAAREGRFLFGVATGRSLGQARDVLRAHGLPEPDIVIASVGTAIHYGYGAPEPEWTRRLGVRWDRGRALSLGARVPGLKLQEAMNQGPFKVSYYVDTRAFDRTLLDAAIERSRMNVILTQDAYLDVIPSHASKGHAVRFLCDKWGIPQRALLVCGDSGNDWDMLAATGPAVVVGEHAPDLDGLRGRLGVFFSRFPGALGILDGMRHHRFLDWRSAQPPLGRQLPSR